MIKGFNKVNDSKYVLLVISFGLIWIVFYNIAITGDECPAGQKKINDSCCILSKKFQYQMCENEANELLSKLNNSIKRKIISSGDSYFNLQPPFYFIPPKDYYTIKDVKFLGAIHPYYLVKTLENNEICEIKVNVKKFQSDNFTEIIRNYQGAFKESKSAKLIKDERIINKRGIIGYQFEMVSSAERKIRQTLFFHDNSGVVVSILISCPMKMNAMHFSDYDKTINSFNWG